eukprot:1324_1
MGGRGRGRGGKGSMAQRLKDIHDGEEEGLEAAVARSGSNEVYPDFYLQTLKDRVFWYGPTQAEVPRVQSTRYIRSKSVSSGYYLKRCSKPGPQQQHNALLQEKCLRLNRISSALGGTMSSGDPQNVEQKRPNEPTSKRQKMSEEPSSKAPSDLNVLEFTDPLVDHPPPELVDRPPAYEDEPASEDDDGEYGFVHVQSDEDGNERADMGEDGPTL